MADDLSLRLATPIDQVIPGLTRLADTLNSPVLRSMPTDLGPFMEVINDLSKRMSPLAQIAEQAGSMFGLRIPGLSRQAAPSASATAPVAATAVSSHAAVPSTAAAREAVREVWEAETPAPSTKRAARKAPAKKAPAKKRAATKRTS